MENYYAVIFTSTRTEGYQEEYSAMASKIEELAETQEGFLGIDSAREAIGISVSYWKDKASIKAWKDNTDHLLAQELGIRDWYSWYNVKIALVEQEYEFNNSDNS